MDSQQLAHEVEQVINTVYTTKNENERREANVKLQQFMSSQEAWSVFQILLTSNAKCADFVSANGLYTKIKKEWKEQNEHVQQSVHNTLISYIRSYVANPETNQSPQRTLRRVSLGLSAIAVQTPGAVKALINEASILLSGGIKVEGYTASNELQHEITNRAYTMCTEILHDMPEEHSIADIPFSSMDILKEELRGNVSEVLRIIEHIVLTPQQITTETRARAVDCVQSWAKEGLSLSLLFQSHYELTNSLLQQLNSQETELLVACSNALMALMNTQQYPTPGNLEDAQNFVVKSLIACKQRLAQTVQERDEESAHAIVKLVCLTAEQCVDRLATGVEPFPEFISLIMDCTNHPIRLVARNTLDFWLSLQDIPLVERHPSLREPCYVRLLEVLVRQSQLENSTRTLEDIDYDIQSFRESSDGVVDALSTTWFMLQSDYIQLLLNGLRAAQAWQDAEVIFFALDAVAKDVESFVIAKNSSGPRHATVCELLNAFFSDMPSLALLQSHPLVLRSAVILVGNYAKVLHFLNATNTTIVENCLSPVVKALHSPQLNAASGDSLRKMCIANTKELANQPAILHAIIEQYKTVPTLPIFHTSDTNIIEGIVRVISEMKDYSSAGGALESLVAPSISALQNLINNGIQPETSYLVVRHIDILKTTFRFLDCNWVDVNPKAKLLETILPLLKLICEGVMQLEDSKLTDALYSLFEKLITVATDQVAPHLEFILKAAAAQYRKSSNSSCLSFIKISITLYGKNANDAQISTFADLIDVIYVATYGAISNGTALDNPEVLNQFFELLKYALIFCPASLFGCQSFDRIFVMTSEYTTNQEKQSTRAALIFLSEMFKQCYGQNAKWGKYKMKIEESLCAHGSMLTLNVIKAITVTAPEILCHSLSTLFYELTCTNFERCQQWVIAALQNIDNETKSSGGVILTANDKEIIIRLMQHLKDTKQRFVMFVGDVFHICRGTRSRDALLTYQENCA